MYKLYTTYVTTPMEYSIARIGLRTQHSHYAKLYQVGDYLNDYMALVEINNENVVVIHCDRKETLEFERGEPPSERRRIAEDSPVEQKKPSPCQDNLGESVLEAYDAGRWLLYSWGVVRWFPEESSIEGACLTFKPQGYPVDVWECYDNEGVRREFDLDLETVSSIFGPLPDGMDIARPPYTDPFEGRDPFAEPTP